VSSRAAHHPDRRDPLPDLARGRPGTVVAVGGAVDCATVALARASWPVEGPPLHFMRSGSAALGTKHGRRLSRVGQRGSTPWPERVIFGDSAASSPSAAHSWFTSLDSAGGSGRGRGAGMNVAVVEPSHTIRVELVGCRVMPWPAPPMVRARAADPGDGSLPVVRRGRPVVYTVRPIGAASARLMSPGSRGVHRDETRLSRRLPCLANREPRTQHPRAGFSQPISHRHRWPAAPLRRDDQSGNVPPPSRSTGGAPPASGTPRAGQTTALTLHRRLDDIRADLGTGPHG
jgi:hypothetical protein